jgi:SHS2 domain-containing protein
MDEKSYSWAPSPHTADIAISIIADSHDGLFMAALEGLLGSLELPQCQPEPDQITDYTLTQKSGSIESNLVDFLNECIFLMEVEELIPFEFSVIEYSRGMLKAALKCREATRDDKMCIGHIKAATYSDLEVTELEGQYYARIVFDT